MIQDSGRAAVVDGASKGLYAVFIKRGLDFLLALIALPIFGVLCLVLVPLIRLSDGGPAFYVARRLGRNGTLFEMYKFRSMVKDAPDLRQSDGSTYNAADDPRLTRAGRFLRKTSLDELPQLLNVLKGDMSIIGPRPDLPEQIEYYQQAHYPKLLVRPGLTGYSQAYYRNSIPWEQRLKLDAWYAGHVGFLLDCKIFFKTLSTVARGSHVYAVEEGSSPELQGTQTQAEEERP